MAQEPGLAAHWDDAYAHGDGWALIAEDRENHVTPAGLTQPFTWLALRRTP